MAVKLKDIYFGRADGLQEAEDKCFESLFYKGNQKYDLLCNDIHKFIISGRKGTGKTILAKYFEREMNKCNIPTRTLTKRQFVLSAYLEKGEFSIKPDEIELFVEYAILRELSRLLLDNKRKLRNSKNIFKAYKIIKSIRTLNKFVSERFPEENFVKVNYEISRDEISELGGEISRDSVATIKTKIGSSKRQNEKYIKNPYYNIIDCLKGNLFYLMKLVPVNIIFDDLDELGVKLGGNKDIIHVLISFISVANELNAEMRRENIENSRVIILMRSDIIKVLNENSTNLNKIIADSEIRLNWIKRSSGNSLHPLMELITTKIRGSNELLKDKTNEEIASSLFTYKVNGVVIMDHMLKNSFGRPRDIINMLNIIKNEYPDAECFEANLFKSTQVEYSTKFIDELRNELSTHCDADIIEEGFKIVKLIKKRTFWIEDVEKVLEEYQNQIKHFKNKEAFIDYAYEYGIIGNTWKAQEGMSNGKNLFSWRYREDGSDTPDYSKKFAVHLALRKSLQV